MKFSLKQAIAASSLALLGAAAIAAPITTDEVAKIEPGMSMDQVHAIAGEGREVNLLGNDGKTVKYNQVSDPLSDNRADVYITYGNDGTVKSVQTVALPHD